MQTDRRTKFGFATLEVNQRAIEAVAPAHDIDARIPFGQAVLAARSRPAAMSAERLVGDYVGISAYPSPRGNGYHISSRWITAS